MKLIAIIEVPDDMFDEYQEWYITSNDELELRHEEDGAYMHFKTLGNKLKLKPMPSNSDLETINECIDFDNDSFEYGRCCGRQELIDEILEGEE